MTTFKARDIIATTEDTRTRREFRDLIGATMLLKANLKIESFSLFRIYTWS